MLSEVYCVWQVVKAPAIISNNPVYVVTYCCIKEENRFNPLTMNDL
jgi:hypothetical protein